MNSYVAFACAHVEVRLSEDPSTTRVSRSLPWKQFLAHTLNYYFNIYEMFYATHSMYWGFTVEESNFFKELNHKYTVNL